MPVENLIHNKSKCESIKKEIGKSTIACVQRLVDLLSLLRSLLAQRKRKDNVET